MRPALLLVHAEPQWLERPALVPRHNVLADRWAALLAQFRKFGLPVHHVFQGRPCGVAPRIAFREPDERLASRGGESVSHLTEVAGLAGSPLDLALRDFGSREALVAGGILEEIAFPIVLWLRHRGVKTWLVADAVGALDYAQAEMTGIRLHDCGILSAETSWALRRCEPVNAAAAAAGADDLPPARIAGRPLGSRQTAEFAERRNPSNWSQVLARVPLADGALVDAACTSAGTASRDWADSTPEQRQGLLEQWAAAVQDRGGELVRLLNVEIGKPVSDARDEVERALNHIKEAKPLCDIPTLRALASEPPVQVAHRPQGVIAAVTPWNNPVAIPVGKIAAALACGNAVVWKPAIEAPRAALTVMDTLSASGIPSGLVNLVFGTTMAARAIVDHPQVTAVSLTGSIAAGHSAAVRCLRRGIPLQAELGGNNAAIIWRDTDLELHANTMARSAFSFAGQRCTAIRRFVVDRGILQPFLRSFQHAVESLRVGDPLEEQTDVGPLVSRSHRTWIVRQIEQALAAGACLMAGGEVPDHLAHGCWLTPVIINQVSPDDPIAQNETFGPVAIVLPADDFEQAIDVANRVPQGLVAALFTEDRGRKRRFAEAIRAGLINLAPTPLRVHHAAPFSGWKLSSLGPPKHGEWDHDFFTHVQAIYGN